MFCFRRSKVISSAVPRIFLSSYFILRQSDFTPQAFCFNTNFNLNNYLSDYRAFSSFFRNIPFNRNFYYNRSGINSVSEHQDTQSSSFQDSTNNNNNFCSNNFINNNYQNFNNKNFSNTYSGGYGTNSRNFAHNRMANHYDLVVLGGGPAGMAAAKEAARLGKKTVMFDFVKPTKKGTTWGVGGTCVNVGCIPKKLMHYASTLRSSNYDRYQYGLVSSKEQHEVDWPKLVKTIQNYLKMLNFSYRSQLTLSGAEYINAYGTLKDNKTVEYVLNGETKSVVGDKVIIAVGERPYVPEDVEGASELAITSDDLFTLKKNPGKTLVVGGSYVALECAGFLNGLGYDVTVSVRSILLRGFDRQCADKVGELMEACGVVFLYKKLPKKIEKDQDRLKVTFNDGSVDHYDTVLYAAGRVPLDDFKSIPNFDYKELGLEFDKGYNLVTNNEETNLKDVYAVGDILSGKPKLAPVAIKSAELLVHRLYNNSDKQMNYDNVPSCVYTPFEYSCCGLTEEEAIEKYGENNIEVYLKEFSNLELSPVHRVNEKTKDDLDFPPTCLTKLICLKDDTIVGLHFVGPNAGEIMQGFSVLLALNAKKSHLDDTVGIHPTDAESFMNLTVTRSSKESWLATGGCAGGKCG